MIGSAQDDSARLIRILSLVRLFGALLWRVSLTVGSSEAVALLGPNGGGKTTLLSLARHAAAPHARRGTGRRRRRACGRPTGAPAAGLVAHGAHVYEDLTARENLRFWKTLSGLTRHPTG